MNVSLTHELEDFINTLVKSGAYQSASEVVRDGLRLLHERDEMRRTKLLALRADIDKALKSSARGDTIDGAAAFRQLRAKAAARAKTRRPAPR